MKDMTVDRMSEVYLRESVAWDQDRLQLLRQGVRRAWQVATLAGVGALLCALALVMLMPLKRTEPYVIRVDSSTGVVDSVPLYTGRLAAEQSITRYFLTHYVLVCERFDYATAESDYEECGAFHTARTNQTWAALWSRANPQSPLNLHRDGSQVSVQIESVSFLQQVSEDDDLAQVRYTTTQHTAGSEQQLVSYWIATIQYAYASPSQDPSIRRWNPLGFKILDFVAEPEVMHESGVEQPAHPEGVEQLGAGTFEQRVR
jgi:type IV secretion system protein VirB8